MNLGVIVIAVGDELLAGAHADLNSPAIARQLAHHGRHLMESRVVRDDEGVIAEAVTQAAAQAGVVIVTGGLGPTLDDVTRHGVAKALGVELEHSDEAWGQIQEWYRHAGREIPESNKRQALMPAGATVLKNRNGTAPGIRSRLDECDVFVLPGPPREMKDMFLHAMVPFFVENKPVGEHFETCSLYLVDLSESVFADQAGDWMARGANPTIGCTVKEGVTTLRLVARGSSPAEAQQVLVSRRAELRERFAAHLFSESSGDIAEVLAEELLARDLTVTVAESCTGGAISARLTGVAGISAVLRESVVTYSNQAKAERLGVPEELLERHGAVSSEVAAAMAAGAAERAGARLALSVTGIAGPDGGTDEKPVGLVWFGVCLDGQVSTYERRWPPTGRNRVRAWATTKGLSLLLAAVRTLQAAPQNPA